MKESEMILGYVEYNDGKCPFVYEKGILNVLPATEDEWEKKKSDLLIKLTEISRFKKTHSWIDNECFRGITNKGKEILFITNGIGSNNNGFMKYEVQIIYEYESDSPNGDLISGLTIKSNEINYFFNPARVFKDTIIFEGNNKVESISVEANNDLNNTKDCGTYNIGDLLIHIEISAYPTISTKSDKPLSAQSQIYFEFDSPVNIDKALDIISQQESFLRYICYRKNVNLKSIDVTRRNEENLRRKEGEILIVNSCIEETSIRKSEQILTFELLEGNISGIFQSLADGEMYLKHLCECVNSRNIYDTARVILLFTAFESEYETFFGSEPIRSDRYFDVKEDILELLNRYKETCPNRKSKDYVESFKTSISYNDKILSACIGKVIESNLETIKIFLLREYQGYEPKLINDMSQRLSTMRNHIAHGNLNLEIEPINISDLKILESLIYMMRLSSLGISKESIQKGICKLIGYNIYIPDELKEKDIE